MFHTVIRETTSSCKKSKQMQTVKVTGGTKTLITDRKSEYLTSTRVREYSSQCESQCESQCDESEDRQTLFWQRNQTHCRDR